MQKIKAYMLTTLLFLTSIPSINAMDFIKQWITPNTAQITSSASESLSGSPEIHLLHTTNIFPQSLSIFETDNIQLIKTWALPVGIICAGGLSYYLHNKLRQTQNKLALTENESTDRQERLSNTQRQLETTQNELRSVQNAHHRLNAQIQKNNNELNHLYNNHKDAQDMLCTFIQKNLPTNFELVRSISKKNQMLFQELRTHSGENLLHDTVSNASSESLEALLQLNIDLNLRNRQGETALYLALKRKNLPTLQILLNAGANPNTVATTANNFQPLHLSIISGDIPITKLLLENGAQIDNKTTTGETPLSLALIAKKDMLQTVLEAHPNITNTLKHLKAKKDRRFSFLLDIHMQQQINQKKCCPACSTELTIAHNQNRDFQLPSCCYTIFCDECLKQTENKQKVRKKPVSCTACQQSYSSTIKIQNSNNKSLDAQQLKANYTNHTNVSMRRMPPYKIDYPQPTFGQYQKYALKGFDGKPYLPCYDKNGYVTHCVSEVDQGGCLALCFVHPEDHSNYYIERYTRDDTPILGMILHTKVWDKRSYPSEHINSYKGACQLIDCFPELTRQHKKLLEEFALFAMKTASQTNNVSAQLACLEPKQCNLTKIKSVIHSYQRSVSRVEYQCPTIELIHALNLFFDTNGIYKGLPKKMQKLLFEPITELQKKLSQIIFNSDGSYKGLINIDDQKKWNSCIKEFTQKYVHQNNARRQLPYQFIDIIKDRDLKMTLNTPRIENARLLNKQFNMLSSLYVQLKEKKRIPNPSCSTSSSS
jgi:hypothetical protein